MADWPALLARRERTLAVRCYLSDKPVRAISGTYDYGWDSVSGAVSVRLAELYPWIPQAGILRLELGWDGYTQQVAKALVSSKDPSWWPLENTIQAQGYLSRAQHPYSGDVTYTSGNTDQGIVSDLLSKSVVPNADIQGQSLELLSVADYELKDGFTPWSAIEEVDRVTSYRTFETPGDGVVRRRLIYLGIPSSGYAYSYEEGENYVQIRRKQGIESFYNRVIVEGLAGEDIRVIRRTDSDLVPRDYTERVSSELIQTEAHADAVGAIKLLEGARIVDVLEIRTPGDPRVQPGQTCRVLAPEIGITSWTNYYIRHVHGEFGPQGWWLTLTVEGGTGTAGYLEPLPPEAVFEFTVTRETVEIGGVQSTIYTVMCDAALSYDPDGLIVGYSWSNNKNADTGTASTYATYFTQAQAEAAQLPSITLEVTDNGDPALTGTITLEIDVTVEAVTVRQLYVAARSRAEATPSGGAQWYTHTPASGLVLATPDRAGEDHSYYGLSGGNLLFTSDNLLTAPTVVHTFASQINTVSVCESNASRVAVGLENGEVWATDDAQNLAEAVWQKMGEFAAPVLWLTENPFSPGLYGVSSGSGFYLLYGSVGTATGWFALDTPDTARKHVGSPFANYGCGTLGAGSASTSPVKREDGVPITFPVVEPAVTDVWAIAHHAREDVLYCADDDLSGNARVWVKAAGATEFTLLATITGAGFPRHLKGDGDHPQVFYLACDDGLYKSFDACRTWYRMRAYSGDTLAGLQVGFGAASWEAEVPLGGRRVFVMGVHAGDPDDHYTVCWTDDVWAQAPVWHLGPTNIVSGNGYPPKDFALDPLDSSNGVYMLAGDYLYYCPNVREAGAVWTRILGLDESDPIVYLHVLSFAVASDGTLYATAKRCEPGNVLSAWIYHSHDHGQTWLGAAMLKADQTPWTGLGALYTERGTVLPSRVDPQTVYCVIRYISGNDWFVNKTTDGGHTITCTFFDNSTTITSVAAYFNLAAEGDDDIRINFQSAAGDYNRKSTDGLASNPAVFGELNLRRLVFDPADPTFAAGHVWSNFDAVASNTVYRSTDGGQTLSQVHVFEGGVPEAVQDIHCHNRQRWLLLQNGGALYRCDSDALDSWAEVSNLDSDLSLNNTRKMLVDPTS